MKRSQFHILEGVFGELIRMFRSKLFRFQYIWVIPMGIILSGCHSGSRATPIRLSQQKITQQNSPFTVAANMTGLPGIRPDLFDAPATPNSLATYKTPPIAVKPVCSVLGPPNVEVDPLKDYVYKGLVDLDGTEYALLENPTTREGYFSKVGDSLEGADVVGISKDWVRYTTTSGQRQLAMNKNYSLVPLSKGGSEYPIEPNSTKITVADTESYGIRAILILDVGQPYASGISDEEAKNLQSQVFDGKITQSEAMQKGLGSTSFGSKLISGEFVQTSLTLDDKYNIITVPLEGLVATYSFSKDYQSK